MGSIKRFEAGTRTSQGVYDHVSIVLVEIKTTDGITGYGECLARFGARAYASFINEVLAPKLLVPFNRLWARFGLLLHRITSPLVLGIMFFVVITPMGWIMRALGKDLLRLKIDPAATSYWIARTPPGPTPESLKEQF